MFTDVTDNGSMNLVLTRTAQRKSRTSNVKDRREAGRYGVKMPLRYRAAGAMIDSAWEHGHTLNMSAGGVLVDIPEVKAVGSALELAIDWPGLYHDKPMVRLFLTGSVARLDGRRTALRILRNRAVVITERSDSPRHARSESGGANSDRVPASDAVLQRVHPRCGC